MNRASGIPVLYSRFREEREQKPSHSLMFAAERAAQSRRPSIRINAPTSARAEESSSIAIVVAAVDPKLSVMEPMCLFFKILIKRIMLLFFCVGTSMKRVQFEQGSDRSRGRKASFVWLCLCPGEGRGEATQFRRGPLGIGVSAGSVLDDRISKRG